MKKNTSRISVKHYVRCLASIFIAIVIVLTTASCGSGHKTIDGETSDAAPENRSETVVPGEYAAVSLVPGSDIAFNENGSYDYGDEKGVYNYNEANYEISLQAKEGTNSVYKVLTPYIYAQTAFVQDDEYGLAPSFDSEGKSTQSFTLTNDDKDSFAYKLSLSADGTFEFIYTEGTNSDHLLDTISYKGNYTFNSPVLSLTYNQTSFPMIFADGALYPFVYEKKTEQNKAVIEALQNTVQSVHDETVSLSWWAEADEATKSTVKSALLGSWEISNQFSSSKLVFTEDSVSIDDQSFNVSTIFADGTYSILKGAILVKYKYYAKGSGYMVYMTEAIPYVLSDAKLTLYERLDVLNTDGIESPDAKLTDLATKQYQKSS